MDLDVVNETLLNETISKFQKDFVNENGWSNRTCLLYTSPSPRDATLSRMPSSA